MVAALDKKKRKTYTDIYAPGSATVKAQTKMGAMTDPPEGDYDTNKLKGGTNALGGLLKKVKAGRANQESYLKSKEPKTQALTPAPAPTPVPVAATPATTDAPVTTDTPATTMISPGQGQPIADVKEKQALDSRLDKDQKKYDRMMKNKNDKPAKPGLGGFSGGGGGPGSIPIPAMGGGQVGVNPGAPQPTARKSKAIKAPTSMGDMLRYNRELKTQKVRADIDNANDKTRVAAFSAKSQGRHLARADSTSAAAMTNNAAHQGRADANAASKTKLGGAIAKNRNIVDTKNSATLARTGAARVENLEGQTASRKLVDERGKASATLEKSAAEAKQFAADNPGNKKAQERSQALNKGSASAYQSASLAQKSDDAYAKHISNTAMGQKKLTRAEYDAMIKGKSAANAWINK